LSPNRQIVAVPASPVAPNLNEALDIHLNLTPEFTFHFVLFVNGFPEAIDLLFSKVAHLGIRTDIGLSQYLPA
jgi:hypothetical protein